MQMKKFQASEATANMRSYLSLILILMGVTVLIEADTTPKMTTTITTERPKPTTDSMERRDKRQLVSQGAGGVVNSATPGTTFPIFFDGVNVGSQLQPLQPLPPLQPLQPLPPVQTLQPLQPITVVTPVAANANSQNQQPPGFLPNFSQNLPIFGTLISNLPALPNLVSGLGLGSLGGGFGTLGGLNLGNLGLGNLAVTPVAAVAAPTGGSNAVAQCPLTQKLNCRCEPLISLPIGLKPQSATQLRQTQSQLVQIMKQNSRRNDDGSQEMRLIISSGHVIYQKMIKTNETFQQKGFYSLPIQTGRYFTIYYNINDTDYTVRADVSAAPPKTDFDDELSGQVKK